MGLATYGFAFFIFVLLCLFALICRFLFSNLKKQQLHLEEKEKKLLTLYSTLEETMDDFTASMQHSRKELDFKMQEIREIINGYKNRLTTLPPASGTAPMGPYPEAANHGNSQRDMAHQHEAVRSRGASQAEAAPAQPKPRPSQAAPPSSPAVQPKPAMPPSPIPPAATSTTPAATVQPTAQAAPTATASPAKPDASERTGRILALANQGYDRVRIAKELSVTLSEIDLVMGIQRTKK